MTPPRLRVDDTLLLVIDVQDRLMPTLRDPERLNANTAILLRIAEVLGIPAIVTEQYPRGLGHTTATVREAFAQDLPVVEKTRFSAWVPDVETRLRASGRNTVLACGIEAHVCVLQTVLDLRAAGWQVFLCTDAVSAGQADQIAPAFRRMEAAGAVSTGVLSATYELLADKEHPAFRVCLELVKAVRA